MSVDWSLMRSIEDPGSSPVFRIGTAGWNVPKNHADRFPSNGPHLDRYGAVFNAVEINTSFYRPHRRETYERWAAAVPTDFRFAVKVPKAVSHERRLQDCNRVLDRFLEDAAGLGPKLGPVLLQLPPSLAFQPDNGGSFLRYLRQCHEGPIVCEPRHPSWFEPGVQALLTDLRIARVAADPAPVPAAAAPGGWLGITYRRLHGSPRMYYSAYPLDVLTRIARHLAEDAAAGRETWCILDNTAAFAAAGDALSLKSLTGSGEAAILQGAAAEAM
jgi:uncharacterized protein YecE (DUF72 family)